MADSINEQDTSTRDLLTDYNKFNIEEYIKWKIKLKTVIHSKSFCGICFEEKATVWNIDEKIDIVQIYSSHNTTFRELVTYLFNDSVSINHKLNTYF